MCRKKSNSSELVAAVEGSVFWKCSRPKKAALQKKYVYTAEYCFSEKSALILKNFQNVAFLKKLILYRSRYLLWKSSSFLDIFILNSSPGKNSCSKK